MTADSRSVLDRASRPPDRTVSYGDHPDALIDLRGPVDGPAVVFLHGGFWRAAYDRGHVGPLSDALSDAGYLVATPEYRRTGAGGGWPATFDDVRAALAALAPLLRRRYVLAGHSAGGHLALWAAAVERPPDLAGVLALAPVADLTQGYALDLDSGAVAALLGGGPEEVPDRYAAADPMRLPWPAVDVTLIHGKRDAQVPVDFSRHYVTRAPAGAGVLVEPPDTDHFAVIDPLSRAWPEVVAALGRLSRPRPGV